MSYDLWAWAGPALDNARLAQECELVSRGEPSALVQSPALGQLVAEVEARFPPLESLSEDELERSPWSVSPEAAPGLAAFAMGFRWAERASPEIVEAALRLGLRVHDPQTRTAYTPSPILDGSRGMWWEPGAWGCAAVWRWGGDATSPAKRKRLRLTLGRAHAAIAGGTAASFVVPVDAGQVLAALPLLRVEESRPPLVVEPVDGAVLIRYRREDEGPVIGALCEAARPNSLNVAAPLARSDESWYLVAGDVGDA
jgi:hypothetical protein